MMKLKDVLKKAIDTWVTPQPPRVRPSVLGNCVRKTYFSIVENNEEDFASSPASSATLFDKGYLAVGKIYELAILPFMEREGFTHQPLIIIDKERGFWGHADFLKIEGDTAYVVDIKTTAYSSLDFLPHESNVLQIQAYMHGILYGEVYLTQNDEPVLRLPTPTKCYGALLYIVRENPAILSEQQEFWFEYDPKSIEVIFKLHDTLQDYISKKKEPPIPSGYSPFSYPCYLHNYALDRWCPFWEKCWGERVAETANSSGIAQLAEEVIRAYAEEKIATKKYQQLRKVLLDALSSATNARILTQVGVVEKQTKVTHRVKLTDFIREAKNEGLLSNEDAVRLQRKVQQSTEYPILKVTPYWHMITKEAIENGEKEDGEEMDGME